ncbi:MAG: GntR family transcriptional regulator [Pseudolabrys sp.]|nr:GntR family transcriptional regulator [Pseudolabrys sp.]MDP2294865.1 GntR family transcriptional regulator [Pseudolabrys sp.]
MRNSPYDFLSPLQRDKRGGTVQNIQDVIRDAIVRLDLAPGEFIDKKALCEQLGTSRFPVSEALGRLADEGFVEVLPQHGTRVTRIDLADCTEAMFIRRALESEGLRRIAPRIDLSLIEAINRSMQEQQVAMAHDDRIRFHECDIALHDMLLDALGYERVKTAVFAARAKLDRLRLYMCTPRRQASTLAEHRAIVEALAARDAAAAGRAMELHLDMVMEELTEFAAANPDAFEPGEKTIAAA